MSNYRLHTGPFAGSVIAEGRILDVPFAQLDDDMQVRIREWAETEIGARYVEVNGCDFAYSRRSGQPLSMNTRDFR